MDALLWCKAHKANARGLAPVSLRLTVHGRRAEYATGVRVAPADWHQLRQKVRGGAPGAAAYNDLLTQLPGLATAAKNRLEAVGRPVTAAALAALLRNPAALRPGPAPCLLQFMENELDTHYLAGNRATYEALRAIVRKLRAWHGPDRLPLEALAPARAQAFYRHLLAAKGRGGEVATANKAVVQLTGLFRRGIRHALWAEAQNPFLAVDRKPAAKRGKVRLTAAQHRAVAALALPRAGWLWRARAAYLLQFYLRGERVGACLMLKWSDVYQDGAAIRYQAQKNGPYKEVPVRPELAALLTELGPPAGPYLLPYLPADYARLTPAAQLSAIKAATAVINKALKEVAVRAGVDKALRTHAARHTFATVAGKAVGARAVQQMLGHTTLKMTEIYLAELDRDELDLAADAAFDSL